MISFAPLSAWVLFSSSPPPAGRTGTAVSISRVRVGWKDGLRPDRLMVREVLTPGGNSSSYLSHNHDLDRPPHEVKREGIDDHPDDRTLTRCHGDVVTVRHGYRSFVTPYGY
jgi:5-deoxy-D-glucuronate isomerase